MSATAVSIYLDALGADTNAGDFLHRSLDLQDRPRISGHIHFYDVSLWGYKPENFRALAATLMAVADELEAAQATLATETQQAATPTDVA